MMYKKDFETAFELYSSVYAIDKILESPHQNEKKI